MTEVELNFLWNSNGIEDEWDALSLWDSIVAWQYCRKQKSLTPEIVRETHRLLMRTRNTLKDEDKGHYRTCAVYIGGHEGKPFYAISNLIVDWCTRVNQNIDYTDYVPEEKAHLAQEDHVAYEDFHPFIDGNGRTGRIFYNWQRLKLGLPIHVIEEVTKYDIYYKWFTYS